MLNTHRYSLNAYTVRGKGKKRIRWLQVLEDRSMYLRNVLIFFFFLAEKGIRDFCLSRGVGDV